MQLTHGRDAYYITNGKAVEVTWIKAGESDPTIYLDKKTGEQIEMNTGKILCIFSSF